MIKMRPLSDRLVIKRKQADETSEAGIILPNATQKNEGEVLAVGPGRLLDSGELAPMSVKVGDCVLFGGYSGTEVKVDGEDYIIISQSDVLAVL